MGLNVNPALIEYLGNFFQTEPSLDKAVSILENLPATKKELCRKVGLSERATEDKLNRLKNDAHLVGYIRTKEQHETQGMPYNTWYKSYTRFSDHLSNLRRNIKYAFKGE